MARTTKPVNRHFLEGRQRSTILALSLASFEKEILGLSSKVQVDWRDFRPGSVLTDPECPGYYVEGCFPREAKVLTNLREAYPSCLFVRNKQSDQMHSVEIYGLPERGIGAIDFTHYCLGPAFTVDFRAGSLRKMVDGVMMAAPISFFKQR